MADHVVARVLLRAGRWDEALAALPPDALAARAEILVDRHWWRLDAAGAAAEAVAALRPGDPESYAVRHIGDHLLQRSREEGIDLLRRSYHLRACLGARPQTAAAAATLAAGLGAGAQADQLREAAGLTARELGLTWLLPAVRAG
ncbi:hypothetical protein [Actinoplanes sp. DH11]|uniref:hypothetical protein n=1 Tax=Actinoplanes sp. DH11 TaxID=2857011 RepID=UPI001E59D593|nr:hypothetical protein [Actinoplanes sp. DH11]